MTYNVASSTEESSHFFTGKFTTFGGIWLATTVWYTIGVAFLYFVCGIIASFIFRRGREKFPGNSMGSMEETFRGKPFVRKKIAILIPIVTTLYGIFIGIAAGSIYGVAIALIYFTGSFEMPAFMSAVWGLGLSVFYLVSSFAHLAVQW